MLKGVEEMIDREVCRYLQKKGEWIKECCEDCTVRMKEKCKLKPKSEVEVRDDRQSYSKTY